MERNVIAKDLVSGEFIPGERFKLSNFIPVGLRDSIERIPYGNYLICVGYDKDNQIGVSGHPHEGESIEDGFRREILEELSLEIKFPTLKFGRRGKFSFLTISLRNMILVPHLDNEKLGVDRDDRVIICVHGSFDEVYQYLEKVSLSLNNVDKITKIWAMKREEALLKIEEMTEGGKKLFPEAGSEFFIQVP